MAVMVTERIRSVIEAPLAALGLLVEDVTVTPVGRRRVVRIAVDRDVGTLPPQDETSAVPPMSLDDIAEATRAVDSALDESDVLGDTPYTLEVSSPGVSRPLTEWRHLRRNVGRLVTLRLVEGGTVTGRIRSVGAQLVHLQVEPGPDAPEGQIRVLVEHVRTGTVHVEFGRAEGPEEETA